MTAEFKCERNGPNAGEIEGGPVSGRKMILM